MLSEEPSLNTILRGVRGVRIYVERAARAQAHERLAEKGEAVSGAASLLLFLQGISVVDGQSSLGQRLVDLYTSFQVSLTRAHASNSVAAFKALSDELKELNIQLGKLTEVTVQ